MSKSKIKALCYCSICIAIAFVLGQLRLFRMPQGGSVTACGMLFITLTGYWFGAGWGAAAGAAYGFLDLFMDPYVIHPIQFLLDYPVAYSLLGFLPAIVRRRKFGLYTGYLIAVFGRFVSVFVSGVVFFGEYSPQGDWMLSASVVNSLSYNLSYILPEVVISLVIISIPAFRNAIERQKVQS